MGDGTKEELLETDDEALMQQLAQGGTTALGPLYRKYRRLVQSLVRQSLVTVGESEAEDLTQGFFALLLERKDLCTVRKEKGRLRSYLLVSLKHFLADERRRAMALKRGKGQRLVPLEELRANERRPRAVQLDSWPLPACFGSARPRADVSGIDGKVPP